MRGGRVAGAVILLVGVGLSACSGSASHSAARSTKPTGISSATVTPITTVPLRQREVARFQLTGQPDWLAADGHFLYVKEDSGVVSAIDPSTNRIAWHVTAATSLCQGLGVGFGSLWSCSPSASDDSDDIVRINLTTHRVVSTLHVGKSNRQGRLVTDFGRVWVIRSTPAGSALVGIDPVTEKTDPPIPLGMLAVELTHDDHLVWAVGSVAGAVVGVDPQQHKVVRRIGGLSRLGGPSLVTVGDGDLLWVSGDSSTAGIDRTTGKVVVKVAQPTTGYGGFVATKTDLWIHAPDPFLTRIDPTTGQPRERIVAPELPNPGDIIYAFGSLWASCNNQSTLVRLRTS